MVDTYLLRSLKRVHDESERALRDDNPKVATSVPKRFNELLDDFKEEYPQNERIQAIETVRPVWKAHDASRAMNAIQRTKFRTLKIADLLELNTDDFEELSQSEEFAVINVKQEQTQEQVQEQTQIVTVEQIIEDVEGMMMAPDDKEELKGLVREYEDELDNDDPDPSRLRDIATKAKEYSDDVARKLIMLATERGFNILTGLA